jgi:hypothetical protein
MRASTEFVDGRYWTNVGHVCTRCLTKINAREKSERFVTKRGALRARHVGDCPSSSRRRRPVTMTINEPLAEWGRDLLGEMPEEIAAQMTETPGCGCADCLLMAANVLRGSINDLHDRSLNTYYTITSAYEWHHFTICRDSLDRAIRSLQENPGDTFVRDFVETRTTRLRPLYLRMRRLLWERAGM